MSGDTLSGTTSGGGFSAGNVFKLKTNGAESAVLKSFDGGMDGGYPEAELVLSGTTPYGTTVGGDRVNLGTVFKVDVDGNNFAVLKD